MRLLELRANQETFRTVRFNETGLSLVIGRKTDPEDRSREHSTNGVGKSLLLYLVSFCLGSSKNDELKEKLPGWEFTLVFTLGGQRRSVSRSTENQNTVLLDNEELSLTAFTKLLGHELFGLSEPVKHLTFRSLIGLFLRQGKPAYISPDQATKKEQQYTSQIRSSYLLGLDEQLVDKKRELKEEYDRLKSNRAQFKKDSLLRDYFLGERDVDLELKDLEEEISRLQHEASTFRVAENYEQIAADAESTRRAWKQARNGLNSLESSLRQIEATLTEQPDVSAEEVRRVYEAAAIELPEAVTKRLADVTEFHRELIESRSRRLTLEKHQIERRISELKSEIAKLNSAKDKYYQFLGSHGALQEYEAMLNTLAECKRRAERLSDFQKFEEECQERTRRNKLEMSEENIRTSEYLKAAKTLTDGISERFRDMARRIWPGRTCGLVIHNNEGENKLRFNIDAKIQGDASDGTNETKIFCFDLTVLLGRQNHRLEFLMHDNRLYSEIDPRQRAELFRVAWELSKQNNCQYIASLNEENLVAMREIMEADDYTSVLSSNIVLELTDDSDEGKLLGVTVDLVYD